MADSIFHPQLIGANVFTIQILVLCFVLSPAALISLIQAIAGILYPVNDPKLVRYQQRTAVLVGVSVVLAIVAVFLLFTWFSLGVVGYSVAVLFMLVAGCFGVFIERDAKRNSA